MRFTLGFRVVRLGSRVGRAGRKPSPSASGLRRWKETKKKMMERGDKIRLVAAVVRGVATVVYTSPGRAAARRCTGSAK